mgnify:FL=1
MKVAIVADSHFCEESRFVECQRIHAWIGDKLKELDVDLLIHTGDVFERKSTPAERNAVARWVRSVTDQCPMVIVRGNHDALGDLAIYARLSTRHPVIVEEGCGAYRVDTARGPVAVAAIGWPRKAELIAIAEEPGDAGQLANEMLQSILRGLAEELEACAGPRILAAHALVTGSVTSTGQPLVGHDMTLDLSELALARADLYALGHIHLPQDWKIGDAPVVYPGSPRRTSFGEIEDKSFVVADFDGRKLVGWTRVQTPCAPMLFGQDEWGVSEEGTAGWLVGWDGIDPDHVAGAEIRLRYLVDPDQREAAKVSAGAFREDLLARGAARVQVEAEVRAAQRARAPEVAKATTLEGKLTAYWQARGTTPEGARRDRLIALAYQLDIEVRSAA